MPDDGSGEGGIEFQSTMGDGGAGEPGGGGDAGQQAAAQRAEWLLDGYNDAESQAKAFHGQYGWAREFEQRYHSDPAFRQWYDGYGQQQQQAQAQQPQQQAQAQQQQENQQLAFLKHAEDPATIAAYQVALQNNGQLPANYPNREAMMQKLAQHTGFWDNMYFNPAKGFESLLDHPAIQQKIAQLAGRQVQPIQQQFQQQQHQQLIEAYGPKIAAMNPQVQQMFSEGVFGGGKEGAEKALRVDALLKAGQPQAAAAAAQGGQGKPQGQPKTPNTNGQNGQGQNGKPKGNSEGQAGKNMREIQAANSKAAAKEFAKAKIAKMNGAN